MQRSPDGTPALREHIQGMHELLHAPHSKAGPTHEVLFSQMPNPEVGIGLPERARGILRDFQRPEVARSKADRAIPCCEKSTKGRLAMRACTPAVHQATQSVMPIRRFKGSSGSKFYRQCVKCTRKVGPKLDPTDLPDGSRPSDVKWAERAPKGPGNSKRRNYSAYIRSAGWRHFKALRLERDNWTCVRCEEPATDVHHKTYDRFGGRERMEDLESLCSEHHAGEHSEQWGDT